MPEETFRILSGHRMDSGLSGVVEVESSNQRRGRETLQYSSETDSITVLHDNEHALFVDDSVEDLKRRFVCAEVDSKRESEPLGVTGVEPALYINDPFGYLIEIEGTA